MKDSESIDCTYDSGISCDIGKQCKGCRAWRYTAQLKEKRNAEIRHMKTRMMSTKGGM